jgi:hypothetical protein
VVHIFDLYSDEASGVRLTYLAGQAGVVRFYAGQRDRNDPSHVTVDFDADDKRVRIHGRLLDPSTLSLAI